MQHLEQALSSWRAALGPDYVITDRAALLAAQTATFATAQQVPAIICPASREELQACVRIANTFKVPIYPVSRGKNWGYGSRVPTHDGCVIVDLGRLNRILDYDEQLAYVTIEPGVTPRQLFEYLREQGSNLFMSVNGSTPEASLIGNMVERGTGTGPNGDRFMHACALEVVLPTGEFIHTGLERFANAKAARVNRWGVGPALDGLFTQSNLGIVTRLTIWLSPIPEYIQVFNLSIKQHCALEELIDAIRALKRRGLMRTPFSIWNDYKRLSVRQQYPWEQAGADVPLPAAFLESWRQKTREGVWSAGGALYHPSRKHGLIERDLIVRALKDKVDTLFFIDEAKIQFDKRLWGFLQRVTGRKPGFNPETLKNSRFLGVPSARNIASAYWRKRTPVPPAMDPDRDRCGTIWCSPAVPFEGKSVAEAVKIITDTVTAHTFEPNISLLCMSERSIHTIVAIMYDREVAGEDDRAMACHDDLIQRLARSGYIPYRLGVQSMQSLPPPQDDYLALIKRIKRALDPNDILAPGRYDFRDAWEADEG
jgi:4-cresol dehydrogenase (hydroxylating) flavoprotein subunit